MKEIDFQRYVLDVAARFNWRAWHTPYPVRPIGGGKFVPEPRAAGLPDLILIHADPPRLVFAELKGDGGKLTPEQHEFLALARCVAQRSSDYNDGFPLRTVGVYSWRPGDEDQVETTLRSRVLS